MSSVETVQGLKVVDAYDLDDEMRGILKPGDMVRDGGCRGTSTRSRRTKWR